MKEDQLTNAIIDKARELEIQEEPTRIHVEPHYNHYGNRGVADLYTVDENKRGQPSFGHLYEIKSDSAIQSATGANDILRQFTKMVQYFFQDDSWEVPKERLQFELAFLATPTAVQHVSENESMYREALETRPVLDEYRSPEVNVILTFRHPENIPPVRPFDTYRPGFWTTLANHNPKLEQAIGDSLRENFVE